MSTLIRDALPEDVDEMVSLLEELFAIEADFEADQERQRRGLRLMLDGCGKHRCIKVAQIGSKVVGMCSVQTLISTCEGSRVRSLGISSLLLQAVP